VDLVAADIGEGMQDIEQFILVACPTGGGRRGRFRAADAANPYA
jgi:hypothetical protein